MAKISRQIGTTSQIIEIEILDSTSTTGAGKTGLVYNSSGLTCYYKRNTGTASVAVTLASISTLGTFVSGGFKEVDSSNMKGLYEFHIPNAALASGADSVVFIFTGATGMVDCRIEIELTATSNQDGVRGGMSALSSILASFPANFTSMSIDSSGRLTIAPEGLDPVLIESGITASSSLTNDSGTQLTSINLRQAIALMTAVDAAISSGATAGASTITFKQPAIPTGNTRVSGNVDTNGNRSSMTLKVPT